MHTYEPGVFRHSPPEKHKSPSRHSLMSGSKQETVSANSSHTCSPHPPASPVHCLPRPEARYPGRQSHLKEPAVFTQCRSASHAAALSHSSTSADGQTCYPLSLWPCTCTRVCARVTCALSVGQLVPGATRHTPVGSRRVDAHLPGTAGRLCALVHV